jgi:hypothetical protein
MQEKFASLQVRPELLIMQHLLLQGFGLLVYLGNKLKVDL